MEDFDQFREATTDGGEWCVLRTSGRSTLKLAASLAVDGFVAWTPKETLKIRVPRGNDRREIIVPIMPGYVFARFEHIAELLELERMEVKPRRGSGFGKPAHARFTVMRHARQLVAIEDRHLSALRQLEQRAEIARIRTNKAQPFPAGVRVRVKGGMHSAWSGMIGRVVRSDAGTSRIEFHGGRLDVTIRTSFLSLDDVGTGSALTGSAA